MPSKRRTIDALKKLEADRLAMDQRRQALEEQAATELGRIVLGTGLESFSKKSLAQVAKLLGALGEDAALERLAAATKTSQATTPGNAK